jgi:hypothetical protein
VGGAVRVSGVRGGDCKTPGALGAIVVEGTIVVGIAGAIGIIGVAGLF